MVTQTSDTPDGRLPSARHKLETAEVGTQTVESSGTSRAAGRPPLAPKAKMASMPLQGVSKSSENTDVLPSSSSSSPPVNQGDVTPDAPQRGSVASSSTHTARQFVETPLKSRRFSVITTMERWHLPQSQHLCCEWHCAMQALKLSCRGFSSEPCKPSGPGGFSALTDWQCSKCFCVGEEGDEGCTTCGHLRQEDEDDGGTAEVS